ncbi:uncharacterized protein LOC143767108 [Ranitomeya variabilis]|uniref:uncharacterized protein LOC143767108 n=1 Tax=Ranitomeya variabilis TaxID=490064 RepID=UPI00405679A0
MSTDTFAFDVATSSDILSHVTGSSEFLRTPVHELRTRDFEKERRRLISYDLHCTTLAEYYKQNKIPRGLRCNLHPTLFSDIPEYCEKYKRILNKCSLDIIILTIEFLQKAIIETKQNIQNIETQLSSTLSSTEWSTLKTKTEKTLAEHQKVLQERKRAKFQRDTDDYANNRVYKWTDSSTSTRRQPRYPRRDGYYSSGSDSSTNSNYNRRHFLSKGRRGGRHEGDPQGEQELAVLQKGLSFCPTPNWDALQLKKDLEYFYRTIRLKTHFGSITDNLHTPIPTRGDGIPPALSITTLGLRNRSNFCPPRTYHAAETFISLVDKEIDSLIHQQRLGLFPLHSNLSTTEKQALSSLHTNNSIIVKPADKGGAIVVMNRTQYIGEIYRQLADTNTYDIIPRDPVVAISRKIQNVIDTYLVKHTIDQKTATFLVNPHPITPVFYVLPKIHKSLRNPPGRPIVASTDSVLSPLSIFLERILTPMVKTTQSFLLDTGHFLDIIKQLGTVPPHSTLVTLDVNSLYTAIQHTKGIEATRLLLHQSTIPEDAIQFCLDLLTLVLYENYFLFEDTFYIQKCGTAMGSNVAPAYANAFMNHFETTHVFNNELYLQHALCYHRYIDDIFLIWTGPPDTLTTFHSYLNSILPELQFTIYCNTDSVPFLDTTVIKATNGDLSTDMYCKPTDCNSLLLYTSCHPRSLKNSLPRSQLNRVARIVSDPIKLNDRLDTMSSKFQARCYPSKLLTDEKARILSPLSPRPPRNTAERVPFVHRFHPLVPKVHSIIRRHWPLLAKAYPNIQSFKEPALMCNKRPPNIKDQLVRADVGTKRPINTQRLLSTQRNGTFPCLNCASCSNVIKSSTITHPRSGKTYPIHGFHTCDSNFVVYLIKCPCGLLYIGETTQHIKDRISSHKSTIRCGKNWLPLPDHFTKFKHTVAQLKFQVIEKVPRPRRGGDHVRLLRARETFWIYKLDTLAPKGLNREIDWLI